MTNLKNNWPVFFFILYFLIYQAAFAQQLKNDVSASSLPNILLIMSDDQGWGDLGIHGNSLIGTPVLDALGTESVRFDRFFVSPVCAPTRASLLTGRDYLRTNTFAVTGRGVAMRSDEVTIAEILKAAGYRTGIFGKWHNGEQYPNHPLGQGFDEFFGFCGGHWNRYFDPPLEHNGNKREYKGYISDLLTDAAIDFINTDRNNPFFCYVPYNVPHGPYQVAGHYFEKYKNLGFDDKTAAVYGMIENMDENIGRILHTLDSLKIAENTIVVFLTDNGPNGHRFNGNMKGIKASVDEGGVRVPLFIRYPGTLPQDSVITQNAAHIDMLPTLISLAGLSVPDSLALDGMNLLPLLQGQADNWPKRNLFTHYSGREVTASPGGVRTDNFRMVINRKDEPLLYDMIHDPGQQNNVGAKYPEMLDSLVTAYYKWYEEVTHNLDTLPVHVGFPESPVTTLPAHEATLSGGVQFKFENGYTNDWITNWASTSDKISWPVKVVNKGQYDIFMEYACAEENIGSLLQVKIGDQVISTKIEEPFPLEIIEVPNFTPAGNHVDAHWKKIQLGTIQLHEGQYKFLLKGVEIPGEEIVQLKSIYMEQR